MSDNSDFRYLECNDDKKPLPSGMHIHRGCLDHAVAALVQGNGLRITVAGVGSIRFEAIGFDFPSFTERHKRHK